MPLAPPPPPSRLAAALALALLLGPLLLADPAAGQAGRTGGPFPVEAVPTTPRTIQVQRALPVGTFSGDDLAQAISTVRLYVDAGAPAGGFLVRRSDTAGEGGAIVTLPGYLVDLPAPASVPAAGPR